MSDEDFHNLLPTQVDTQRPQPPATTQSLFNKIVFDESNATEFQKQILNGNELELGKKVFSEKNFGNKERVGTPGGLNVFKGNRSKLNQSRYLTITDDIKLEEDKENSFFKTPGAAHQLDSSPEEVNLPKIFKRMSTTPDRSENGFFEHLKRFWIGLGHFPMWRDRDLYPFSDMLSVLSSGLVLGGPVSSKFKIKANLENKVTIKEAWLAFTGTFSSVSKISALKFVKSFAVVNHLYRDETIDVKLKVVEGMIVEKKWARWSVLGEDDEVVEYCLLIMDAVERVGSDGSWCTDLKVTDGVSVSVEFSVEEPMSRKFQHGSTISFLKEDVVVEGGRKVIKKFSSSMLDREAFCFCLMNAHRENVGKKDVMVESEKETLEISRSRTEESTTSEMAFQSTPKRSGVAVSGLGKLYSSPAVTPEKPEPLAENFVDFEGDNLPENNSVVSVPVWFIEVKMKRKAIAYFCSHNGRYSFAVDEFVEADGHFKNCCEIYWVTYEFLGGV